MMLLLSDTCVIGYREQGLAGFSRLFAIAPLGAGGGSNVLRLRPGVVLRVDGRGGRWEGVIMVDGGHGRSSSRRGGRRGRGHYSNSDSAIVWGGMIGRPCSCCTFYFQGRIVDTLGLLLLGLGRGRRSRRSVGLTRLLPRADRVQSCQGKVRPVLLPRHGTAPGLVARGMGRSGGVAVQHIQQFGVSHAWQECQQQALCFL